MKWRMNKGSTVFLAITCAFVLLVIMLAFLRRQTEPVSAPREQRVAVTTLRVEPQSMADEIVLPGRIEPAADVVIAAEQSGRILELLVDEGDRVRQGDRLLRIDESAWRIGSRRAELALREARRELQRLEDLRQTGAVSQSNLEAAETRFAMAELALEEIAIQIDRCTPPAPFNGLVEERYVSAGEFVNPGQPLLRLIDTARVKIVFDVPERDVYTLRPGAKMTFRLDALPGAVRAGELYFVAAAANRGNNAFRAELRADNTDELLRAGMITRVTLVRRVIHDAVMLPLRAVVPMKGEDIVYVVEAEHAVRRIVRIAAIVDGQAQIGAGIEAGDTVILDGNRAVLDGTPVIVENDWQPASAGAGRPAPEQDTGQKL